MMGVDSVEKKIENLGNHLRFLALIGLDDPLRENISQLVKFIEGDLEGVEEGSDYVKNITMRLISGDHIETVRKVAEKAGIIQKDMTKEQERQEYVRGSDPQLNHLGYAPTICMTAAELFERCKGITNDLPTDMQRFN